MTPGEPGRRLGTAAPAPAALRARASRAVALGAVAPRAAALVVAALAAPLAAGCGGEGARDAARGRDGGPAAGSEAAAGAEVTALDPLFPGIGAFAELPREPRATASSAFWEHWGDGRAELSGYRLTTSRYGAPREAELALIYVTEPHDRRTWIKDDAAEPPHRVEVMKLAASAKFLTGIYPYSLMTSVFSPVDDFGGPRFQPTKLTLGAQEWCGSWFMAAWPGPGRLRALRLSYFASEGERTGVVETGAGTLYEDALPIQLRELDGPFAGGGDWEGPLVPALWDMRRGHAEPGAVPATLVREPASRAGRPVTRFTLRHGDVVRVFDVEAAFPRRVLGWTTTRAGRPVERAELLATERLAYWELNAPGDEARRAALGLGTGGYAPPTRPDSTPGC